MRKVKPIICTLIIFLQFLFLSKIDCQDATKLKKWNELIKKRKYKKVLDKIKLIKKHNYQILLLLGKIYYKKGKYKKSIEKYKEALEKLEKTNKKQKEKDKEVDLGYYYFGRCYQMLKKFDKALEFYSRYIKISQKIFYKIRVLLIKSRLYTDVRNFNDALESINSAISISKGFLNNEKNKKNKKSKNTKKF